MPSFLIEYGGWGYSNPGHGSGKEEVNKMAQKPSPTQDESSPPGDGGGPSQDALNIIHKLQENYSFFAELLDEEVAELVSLCKKESYEADQVVFREGDIADHFYLVLSGEIAITIGETEVA